MTRANAILATMILAILISVVVVFGAVFTIACGGQHYRFGQANGWPSLAAVSDREERLCAEDGTSRIETLIGYAKSEIAPSELQMVAWNRLADALRTAAGDLSGYCGAMSDRSTMTTLAGPEAAMNAGLKAIAIVRPALEALYQTLAPEQQRKLDLLIARHRA
jgi:LTXXQ motif family protein